MTTTKKTLFRTRAGDGHPVRRAVAAARAALAGAALCALQSGCAVIYPPIDAHGNNCESYGVSERQNAPMNCPLGPDGLPLVEQVSYRQVQERCLGDAPVSTTFYTWGCVAPDRERGMNRAFAVDKAPKVYRHEQCHCLLGPGHSRTY